MAKSSFLNDVQLESLEVGAAPLVRRFLDRLGFTTLLQQHLPPLPGPAPALASHLVLQLLVTNLLLARQPLYAIPDWASRWVPQHLGLQPGDLPLLNDDRIGRALDHLQRADRATLLGHLVRSAVGEFDIDLKQFHQDTTTATFHGQYRRQPPADQANRPPRITFGYNKDHRPDLKQLLLSLTISDDGAVPLHCKIYDGNTTDDQVHADTWRFFRELVGHSDFLYVADSKLCTRDNMELIASAQGRFLTVMPRTRAEDAWFRDWILDQEVPWQEVHRQIDSRNRNGPEVVYHGFESPQRSREGYRVLWYRSSQKQQQDREARQTRLARARSRLEGLRPVGRGGVFRSEERARKAGERVLTEEGVEEWLRLEVVEKVEIQHRQARPGRPSTETPYRREERKSYQLRVEEDGPALARAGLGDGLFPLMSNDEELSLTEALRQYKYQPFVEKRHEQLKSVFSVVPMWLKNVGRVESMLWLYYVVELVQSLVERQLRLSLVGREGRALGLYPEDRASESPTSGLVFGVLSGHRRHRLMDGSGRELRRFHDALSEAAEEVVRLLDVDPTAYGLE